MLGPWSTHSPLMFCVELVPGQPTSALARPAYQGADLTPPAVVATKPIARRHVVLAAIVLSHCGLPAKARAPRPGTARGLSRRKPSQTSPAPPSRDGQRVRGPEYGQEHEAKRGVHCAGSFGIESSTSSTPRPIGMQVAWLSTCGKRHAVDIGQSGSALHDFAPAGTHGPTLTGAHRLT